MTSSTPARVAIVTGGSGGIGRETKERLGRDGLAVAVAYAGNPGRAKEAVAAIEANGGTAMAVLADVAEEPDVTALFDAVERAYGGVDVVVHAAGIMLLSPLVDLDLADFDRMHRINVRGLPTYTAYAATKGSVDAMTLILARELRGRDITVNAVAPGPTATPLFLNGKDQSAVDQLANMSPLARLGLPADIAEVVSFLAGPARWVNGQVLYANGGVI